MRESGKPLIEHIPHFLNYCEDNGLALNTLKNYKSYLSRFIFWLKNSRKENIKPHELTADDIADYRAFLSRQNLSPLTQNYYLIALRALLGYFTAKDIVSPVSAKITLSGTAKAKKTNNPLELKEIIRLLEAPDIKSNAGLRDRLILEIIIATGLKANQIVRLNRSFLRKTPEHVSLLGKRYLESRGDNDSALFINYRSRKGAARRLTVRSLERITQKYGKIIDISIPVTPEILRWSSHKALLLKESKPREILIPQFHRIITAAHYEFRETMTKINASSKETASWHMVESVINQEVDWLKERFPRLPEEYTEKPLSLTHNDCFRKIAILIVEGKIRANEFSPLPRNSFWQESAAELGKTIRHGEDWHQKTMAIILKHFQLKNYGATIQPALAYGRADLGVHLPSGRRLYFEIGTSSPYKLWFNLLSMENIAIVIVTPSNYLLEFSN